MDRVLVTGGAGFIGSALARALLARGDAVTVLDDLSTAEPDWAAEIDGGNRFVRGSVTDLGPLTEAMAGHDLVVHLAANTDLIGGAADASLDRDATLLGTWNVCEAMRRHGLRRLVFASSGVVYGRPSMMPTPEAYGPMQPESHYAAAKLAGEAVVSGFAHLGEWRAVVLRFGNTVGARSNHGVVHDFVVKLLRDRTTLEILGDGRQAKPYIHVSDLVAGMLHAERHAPSQPMTILNIGTPGTITVRRIAEVVIEVLGLRPDSVELRFTGGSRGWPGDTPLVDLDTTALRGLGWRPRYDAEEAIRLAAVGVAARLRASEAPLVTGVERRAIARPVG